MHELLAIFAPVFAFLSILFFRLWLVDHNRLKKLRAELSELRQPATKDEEDEEDDRPEIGVGSEVYIDIEGWKIRGTIESVAACSSRSENRPGFTFRALNDKNTLWLCHDYNIELVDDEDDGDDGDEEELPPHPLYSPMSGSQAKN